jgi:hypothetical protein
VEEEPYLLELVRYIHLNPVRAKIVKSIKELNKYPWSGHWILVEGKEDSWMGVSEVLSQFSADIRVGIKRYKEFIQAGWDQGRIPELVGGGLIRSLGGWEAVKKIRWRGQDRVACDARILGRGEFVDKALRDSGEELSRREKFRRQGIGLSELAELLAGDYGLDSSLLRAGGQVRKVSRVRMIFIWISVLELGYNGVEVAEWLGISPPAVSRALIQGRIEENKEEINRIIKHLLKTS